MARTDHLDKIRTAELIAEIKRRLGSKAGQAFSGTSEEWNSLTEEQQAIYSVMYFTDDNSGGGSGGGSSYVLVPATSERLGGVIIGDGVTVEEDGTISINCGLGIELDEDGKVTGVGKNVGNHNEIFNDYSANIISGGSYNTVIGSGNSIAAGNYNLVGGLGNTYANGYKSIVFGTSNVIANSATSSFVIGDTIPCIQVAYSMICGNNSNRYPITNASYSIVVGQNIAIPAAMTYSAVFGSTHTLAGNVNNSMVWGRQNVKPEGSSIIDSMAGGAENNLSGSVKNGSIIGGLSNTLKEVSASLVVGRNHNMTGNTDQCVVCGNSNTGTAYAGLIGGNYGETETDNYINIGNGSSSATRNVFIVKSDGRVQSAGGYESIGADYAEYFEWADGNPDGEDRRGSLVSLVDDKVVPAEGNDIFGIVSATPSVAGNSAALEWQGKYKRDVFGELIYDENGELILNPDFVAPTEDNPYIPRSKRKEWAAIGVVGRLIVVDDGSCESGKYCMASNGTATLSDTETRVQMLRRIDETYIEVFIR